MRIFDDAFSLLFEVNMGIKLGERVLVFSDRIRPNEIIAEHDRERRTRLNNTARDLAGFAEAAYGSGEFTDFPATIASGVEPPQTLWEITFGRDIMSNMQQKGLLDDILNKSATATQLEQAKNIITGFSSQLPQIIVAMSNNSTSHTNYRKLACHGGARFASLPHFDPDMFNTSMNVDWIALAERTNRLVEAVNRAEWIRVETPNGTDLNICKKGRHAGGDDGLLTKPGSFGNLPAGEAYFAPLEGKSNGVMVIEWAPTHKLAEPLTLTIAAGRVVKIDGEDPFRKELDARLAEHQNCSNLAELGIGTNDKATRPDNVLEAEKIMGTIHLALGDNTGFGGIVSAPFHEDYVFYQPTLTATATDGSKQVIINNGVIQL